MANIYLIASLTVQSTLYFAKRVNEANIFTKIYDVTHIAVLKTNQSIEWWIISEKWAKSAYLLKCLHILKSKIMCYLSEFNKN